MNGKFWIPQKQSDLSAQTVQVIKKVLDKIPQLPVSVHKIIEMAADMDIGAKELAEVAQTDPVLSSKILTRVNSSYYGLNNRIDDLRVAIVLIGFNAVRNIALQNRFFELLKVSDDNFYDREKLWIHSYLVSVCAEHFVKENDVKRMGVVMTLGVLHDIGKFAMFAIASMMKAHNIQFQKENENSSKEFHLKLEEKFIGVNHTIIGSMLASKWNLSDKICAVLEYHHYPSFFGIKEIPQQYLDDIALICISDLIVNRFLGENHLLPVPHKIFFEIAGISSSIDTIIKGDLLKKLETADQFARNLSK